MLKVIRILCFLSLQCEYILLICGLCVFFFNSFFFCFIYPLSKIFKSVFLRTIFSKIHCVFLKGRVTKSFRALSLQMATVFQLWLKPASRNSVLVSHVNGRSPSSGFGFHCFPRHISSGAKWEAKHLGCKLAPPVWDMECQLCK